jgi:shikimate dehydrogenase
MNIVLIGMRGSGKTMVGKVLGRKLGRDFIDADELITNRVGLPIPEIVQRYGWSKFRDIEEEVTSEVAERDSIINAAGGGVVTREKNIAALKKTGILVWLKASVDTLLERIGEDNERPALLSSRTRREDMQINLYEREPLYKKAADLAVDTEHKTPEEVAEAIMKSLGRTCCLIGHPVEHSLSPLIHNAGYEALGINYTYVSLPVKDIERAVADIKGLNIRGASVTMPHKVNVIRHLDFIDPLAKEIGAVNTIVNDAGVLTGYNFDCGAAMKALAEKTALEGKKTVLIGSGGAASAIAVGLKKNGAKLVILDRTEDRARKLAIKVDVEGFGGLEELSLVSWAEILINATAVGMWPGVGESIIPKHLLHNGLTVFDTVYNPKETRLLAEAKQRECAIVYGYKMLHYQAARQFELFTGRQPPLEVMESVLTQALEGERNAVHLDRG